METSLPSSNIHWACHSEKVRWYREPYDSGLTAFKDCDVFLERDIDPVSIDEDFDYLLKDTLGKKYSDKVVVRLVIQPVKR